MGFPLVAQTGGVAPVGGSSIPLEDLSTRAQIHDLVVRFYREVIFDEFLGPVFLEVAEVDWSVHIPKLIDFWCRVLLGHPGYDGYVLGAHQHVNELETFRGELFDRWYFLFLETVNEGWQGPIAEKAKAHAARIVAVLAHRLIGLEWQAPPETVTANVVARPTRHR
jgi:hemoglobin